MVMQKISKMSWIKCGSSVGGAVVWYTKGQEFESSHAHFSNIACWTSSVKNKKLAKSMNEEDN